MTLTDEGTEVETTEESEEESTESESKRGRDFSKVRPYHEELAAFINEHSGLDPISANQVKATLALRTDYGNTDEAKAAREARKAEVAAEKAKYEGLNPEQIKAAKGLARAEKQAEKLRKRADDAIAKAKALAANPSGSGEDLQTVVEASQEDSAPERKRGLGGRFRSQ